LSPLIGISTNITAQRFRISVRENASDKLGYACPGKAPTWVANLLSKGASLSLPSLIFEAGKHFSNRINTNVITGSSTKREKAAALAWAIISMVNPYIEGTQLWVENPGDPDVSRLCSEILGVGAALELLVSSRVIDGRTIRKRSSRFDYDANTRGGSKRVYIEAKGTFNR